MAIKKPTESQPKIHDSGYKKLFSNHTIFQQLIETFIAETWVKDLDFSSCETLDKSFITDHYKETESDLIYKVKFRQSTIYIYVLLEFQSTVDRFMALRVLYYILSFYMDYRANYKGIKKLPAVFPIVLYNGKRNWNAPTKLEDLIETDPSLGGYAIDFQYLLLNEKAYTKAQLLTIRNIVSTLFLAEGHYDIKLLEQELLNLYEQEEDKQAVSLFLNWFRQLALYGKVSPGDYEKLDYVYRTKEEVQTMLVATFEEERQKIYQQGEAVGLVKGEAVGLVKGKMETQRQMIGQLLSFRFDIDDAERLNLTKRISKINELHHLDALVNILLNKAATFEDFTKLLFNKEFNPMPTDQA